MLLAPIFEEHLVLYHLPFHFNQRLRQKNNRNGRYLAIYGVRPGSSIINASHLAVPLPHVPTFVGSEHFGALETAQIVECMEALLAKLEIACNGVKGDDGTVERRQRGEMLHLGHGTAAEAKGLEGPGRLSRLELNCDQVGMMSRSRRVRLENPMCNVGRSEMAADTGGSTHHEIYRDLIQSVDAGSEKVAFLSGILSSAICPMG